MTARRVVTLVCDKPGCREKWVGGEGESASRVRSEAAKLASWSSHIQAADMLTVRRDLCRWHA